MLKEEEASLEHRVDLVDQLAGPQHPSSLSIVAAPAAQLLLRLRKALDMLLVVWLVNQPAIPRI